MKKILSYFFVIAFVAFLMSIPIKCKKSETAAAEKMNGIEFKTKFGFELPFLDYTSGSAVARGKKQKAEAAALVVWFNDLQLSVTDSIHTTVSDNAQWAGVQRYVSDTTNTDAIALHDCQRFYFDAPGPGENITCSTAGAGFYRSFSADFNYDIHVSNFSQIQ